MTARSIDLYNSQQHGQLIVAPIARWFSPLKAQFHYASWFEACSKLTSNEAGSKLVADRFEAKFHYAIWFEAGSKLVADQLRTCFELASIMEFGFYCPIRWASLPNEIPIRYSMHFPAVLSNYNGMTAYICRRFIRTTAFLFVILYVF